MPELESEWRSFQATQFPKEAAGAKYAGVRLDTVVTFAKSSLETYFAVGAIDPSGGFQDSCRVSVRNQAASEAPASGFGLSRTSSTRDQSRVFPVHLSGCRAFAAA